MIRTTFLTLALACATVLFSGTAARADDPSIVASNWKFTPGTITVHVNQPTTLKLSSTEGVHGIQSDDLGISNTTILPGKTVSITFTPKKTGTYLVHCTVFCGSGHQDMVLTIKVVN